MGNQIFCCKKNKNNKYKDKNPPDVKTLPEIDPIKNELVLENPGSLRTRGFLRSGCRILFCYFLVSLLG